MSDERITVKKWGMTYWRERGQLRWKDNETGKWGVLTASTNPKSDYARIMAELNEKGGSR